MRVVRWVATQIGDGDSSEVDASAEVVCWTAGE